MSFSVEGYLGSAGITIGGHLAYYAYKSWIRYASTCDHISKISKAKVVSIPDLRSLLSAAATSSESESSHEMLVVVRGIAKANPRASPDVLVSQYFDSEKCIVLEESWLSGVYAALARLFLREGKLFDTKILLGKVPSFLLSRSGDGQDSENVIVNLEGSNHPIPLTLIFDENYKNIFGLRLIRQGGRTLAGEKILPTGKEVSVFGMCSLRDGNPQITACKKLPCFLSEMTRDHLLEWLTDRRDVLLCGSLILTSLTIMVLACFIPYTWRIVERDAAKRDAARNKNDTPNKHECCNCGK